MSRRTNKHSFLRNYQKQRGVVGKGTFGEVHCYKHIITQTFVAIKSMNMDQFTDEKFMERLKREVENMKKLNHPNIVRLFEYHETTEYCYFVMEYAERGELFELIKERGRLHEYHALQLFQQIIGGIEYCHREEVVHRDLKPENILIDEFGMVKICDFGLSNAIGPGKFLGSAVGSPNYAAPELLSGFLYFGPEVDIWSTGCILYTMLFGELPFSCRNRMELYHRIRNGKYSIPNGICSRSAQDIIRKMICVSPDKRIDIGGIRKHAWFQQNLPRYLLRPYMKNPDREKIDEESFSKMLRCMSIRPDSSRVLEYRKNVENRTSEEYVVVYNLIKVERYMKLLGSYLNDEFKKMKIPPLYGDKFNHSSFLKQLKASKRKKKKNIDQMLGDMLSKIEESNPNVDMAKIIPERKIRGDAGWYLGKLLKLDDMYQPDKVLGVIFDVLKYNGYVWKQIYAEGSTQKDAPYHIVFSKILSIRRSKSLRSLQSSSRNSTHMKSSKQRRFIREISKPKYNYVEIGLRLRKKYEFRGTEKYPVYWILPYYYGGNIFMLAPVVSRVFAEFEDRLKFPSKWKELEKKRYEKYKEKKTRKLKDGFTKDVVENKEKRRKKHKNHKKYRNSTSGAGNQGSSKTVIPKKLGMSNPKPMMQKPSNLNVMNIKKRKTRSRSFNMVKGSTVSNRIRRLLGKRSNY